MRNYQLPIGPQDAPSSAFEQLLHHPREEERPIHQVTESWQLRPPIVTSGRLAAMPSLSQAIVQASEEVKVSAQPSAPPPASVRGTAPLFHVSFMGPDQQWYHIKAEIGQGAVAAPSQIVPQVPPEPVLHPSWNTQEYTGPLVAPLAASALPWSGTPPHHPQAKAATSRDFLLQYVQPGLAGLMDGSVSTLAPIFSVAFATHQPFTTFLVGMASAVGAGISMTFAEALSDDGEQTGRGKPFIRGGVTGLMTFLSGAGHALPFLITNFHIALLAAYAVVAVELLLIAAIRHKFFGTSWWLSIVQVVGGGALVFVAALLLGNA